MIALGGKSDAFTLIVEDIVTTGGSVQEVVNVVNQSGGEIVGVGLSTPHLFIAPLSLCSVVMD